MSSQNANGSAEAATSPSRGSKHPGKGSLVNGAEASITLPAPAMPDLRAALDEIDSAVMDLDRRTNAAAFLFDRFLDEDKNRFGQRSMGSAEAEAISSNIREVELSSFTLRALCDAAYLQIERSEIGVRPLGADPLLTLVQAYEAGMAALDAADDDLSSEAQEALAAITWRPAFTALTAITLPVPTTEKGALAALRMVIRELRDSGCDGKLALAVLPSVLAFFDRPLTEVAA